MSDEWDPRDGEIARLRWWLEHIYRAGRHSPAGDLREMAYYALQGDAMGDPHRDA